MKYKTMKANKAEIAAALVGSTPEVLQKLVAAPGNGYKVKFMRALAMDALNKVDPVPDDIARLSTDDLLKELE